MRLFFGIVFPILLFWGCSNRKDSSGEKDIKIVVPAEAAFNVIDDTIIEEIKLADSDILLPFSKNINFSKLRQDTLSASGIKGLDKYACGKDTLTYIPFPKQDTISVIVVPMKCGGYAHRYMMLTICKDSIVSDLMIEAERIESKSKRTNVSFVIDKNYRILVTTVEQDENRQFFDYKSYKIRGDGVFIVIPENALDGDCFEHRSDVEYPITSENLMDLDYFLYTCNKVDGMENYSCHDGINYITLKKTEDNKYYVLVNTECGDYAYTDLLVIHNNRIISGMTIDTASYDDGDDSEYSGDETTFLITEDLQIELTFSSIKNGQVASSRKASYNIEPDGRIVRI
ncbi:hypothetical protein [Dysgonomonas sp. 520]|uniref:hypothetical protein n=1 Tax=Dysgonomonas sp. 520 TaxID=2302931 RepID=UPI0013D48CE6|nr:hypothetical protein [Dysgonomonas sp. 520]NDW09219.1 hypothetical protein [Dysgonomonas sp. 520]